MALIVPNLLPLTSQLNRRREELGLSCAALADRSSLSLRTVQRILAGQESDPSFATILALAHSLGLTLQFDAQEVESIRRRQAEQKARKLVAMVQATSALESQALSAETLRTFQDRTVTELLAGSPRKLWAQ